MATKRRRARPTRYRKKGDFKSLLMAALGFGAAILCWLGYCGFGLALEAVVDSIRSRIPEPIVTPAPPPKRPRLPRDVVDPLGATCRIPGCSGTLIRLDRSNKYYLLTAAHCVGRRETKLWHGKDEYPMRLLEADKKRDIALYLVGYTGYNLPVARLAKTSPKRGDRVWHHGYGTDRPGNIEHGKILEPGSLRQACWYTTSLSPGDSGSGQFLEETGELVALGNWGGGGRQGGPSIVQIRDFLGGFNGKETCPT